MPVCHQPAMQRSHGLAHVVLDARDGGVQLRDLVQRGSAKAILPRVHGCPEVVFLNTSGGLAGGDRLDWRLDLGAQVRAIATSQTAERAYNSPEGVARVDIRLTVGAGGWLDWLPQETILYQGSSLERCTRVDLAPEAGCLVVESTVLGRTAMGETTDRLHFSDRREILRDGRPVLFEPLRLDATALAAGSAVLGAARAFASIAMVGPQVADALAPLRAVLDEPGVTSGASAFDGRLTCRLHAPDGWPLRRQIIRALAILRRSPMPRTWQTLERQS